MTPFEQRAAAVALLIGLPMLASCGDPPLGVVVEGERLAVVDMHLHPGEWESIPPATREFLASRFPFPFNTDPAGLAGDILSPEGLVGELDKAGISVGVLMAVYSPATVGIASNELVEADIEFRPDRSSSISPAPGPSWSCRDRAIKPPRSRGPACGTSPRTPLRGGSAGRACRLRARR
jgi:hypothetical protein